MARDTNKDLAFSGQCVAAVLIAIWPHGLTQAARRGHQRAGEALGRTGGHRASVDSVMLASLINLVENTLEGLRGPAARWHARDWPPVAEPPAAACGARNREQVRSRELGPRTTRRVCGTVCAGGGT
jgi:hypothetical protein